MTASWLSYYAVHKNTYNLLVLENRCRPSRCSYWNTKLEYFNSYISMENVYRVNRKRISSSRYLTYTTVSSNSFTRTRIYNGSFNLWRPMNENYLFQYRISCFYKLAYKQYKPLQKVLSFIEKILKKLHYRKDDHNIRIPPGVYSMIWLRGVGARCYTPYTSDDRKRHSL